MLKVRRPTGCPYLPTTLIFEPIELVSIQDSFEFALKYWIAGGPSLEQVRSKNAKYFGCAVGDCDVCTVSPTFIGQADLWMLYRVLH